MMFPLVKVFSIFMFYYKYRSFFFSFLNFSTNNELNIILILMYFCIFFSFYSTLKNHHFDIFLETSSLSKVSCVYQDNTSPITYNITIELIVVRNIEI